MTRAGEQSDSTDTLENTERKKKLMIYQTLFLLIMSMLISITGPSTTGAHIPLFLNINLAQQFWVAL